METITPGKTIAQGQVGVVDVGGATAKLRDHRFIASATTKTATVRMYNAAGQCVKEATMTATTTGQRADAASLFNVAWSDDWVGMEVYGAPQATIYSLASDSTPAVEVTASNGRALVSGMWFGMVPKSVMDAYDAIDDVSGGTPAETNPTVATATSVTILAANPNRKSLFVQNNSGANIMISTGGLTLTGIVPSATNIGKVLPPGASISYQGAKCPTSAITAYQTSGASINTISVEEM